MDIDYVIFNEYKATGETSNEVRINLSKLLFSKMKWGWDYNIGNDTETQKEL